MICPTNHQGRVAGIVIYIFQSYIDGLFVIIRKDFQMIAAGIETCLQDIKMHRRHLWAEDGVVFSHLFGKRYTFDGRRPDHTFFLLFLSGADGS